MISIKINDRSFYPDKSISKTFTPRYFSWDRGFKSHSNDNKTVVFTDLCLDMVNYPEYENTKNVALIIEPPVINPNTYDYIYRNHANFDYVLSHIDSFVENIPNAHYFPNAMAHVPINDWKQYQKSKLINIVASDKKWTVGHKLRHSLINSLKMNEIDILGSSTGNFIKHKVDTLKDYKFSVAIENCQMDSYFSEKLIDCFSCYTIPIYWGMQGIGKFFNTNGILIGNTLEELQKIICIIRRNGDEMYEKMLPAMEENFEIAKKFCCVEDWLYENFLQKYNLL